ncbi:ABC transporter ATP-binding protein [Anaerovoracaceae bacterium 41-7]|uniref:ABC transporter ATP-binding protein n=1 Tax=Anaerotruncus colihominis TaxID=169435 RepID=A0A845QK50_9FIRM|nr:MULTISPECIES: ABC transporter ATP-binding protein [Clostridia]MCI9638793.1 ABC transporter ATP-binding protein [Emergencia sp.]NBH62572.1 ABC transporter ATP-binding protein [Anaerotruncus colihominis]NCE97663.1 ABC transporter ATP-binding protein [Emergencia sp. 1XD21-10]NCF03227.1 ABC transporter ATP-binding protein [Anaerotruncus sp. 80]
MSKNDNLIEVNHLSVTFYNGKDENHAVQDVTFRIKKGEVLGIVGESGSGKSVSAMSIMQLIPYPPGKITGGEIIFKGENLLDKTEEEMMKIRGNQISVIFQEPMTSFNPLYTIGSQIEEAIVLHQKKSRKEAEQMAIDLLREVGISFPEKRVKEYPHQMSGGMLQRAMIAMALSCNPQLLIADEPTTALDVTIQAQILDLIRKLQSEREMSIMMITHDLGVIAEVAKYVVVMYAGRVVEEATVESLFEKPLHPYTKGLMKSIPKIGNHEKLYMIPFKSGANKIKTGCRFCPRCEYAMDICSEKEPELFEIDNGRKIRCWLHIAEKKAGEA